MHVTCEFEITEADKIEFLTRTNGDQIKIKGIHLGQENAKNLASIINSGKTIHVEIKEKEGS